MSSNNQNAQWNLSWPAESNQYAVPPGSVQGGMLPYPSTNQQVVSNPSQQPVDIASNVWNVNMHWYQQMWPQQQPWMMNNFQAYAQQGGSYLTPITNNSIPQNIVSQPSVTANHISNTQFSDQEFQIQLQEWEQKFQKWKEENKNHPDKNALAQYETQWKSWRDQFLQNYYQQKQQACAGLNTQVALQPPAMGFPALYPTGQAFVPGTAPYPNTHYHYIESHQAIENAAPKIDTRYHSATPKDTLSCTDGTIGGFHGHSEIQCSERGVSGQVDQSSRISKEVFQSFRKRPPEPDQYPLSRGVLPPEEDGAYFQNPDSHYYPVSKQSPTREIARRSIREARYSDEVGWYREGWASRPEDYLHYEERAFAQNERYVENDCQDAFQLFKLRALQGRTQPPFFEKRNQEGLRKETAPRSRIEERLALHAGTNLQETSLLQSGGPPTHDTYVSPQRNLHRIPRKIYEPKIFEYFHRPSRVKLTEPFCLEYSHGKKRTQSSQPLDKPIEPQDIPSPTIPAELKSEPPKDSNSLPAQLFPSAAAIDEKDPSVVKSRAELENARVASDDSCGRSSANLTLENKEEPPYSAEPETVMVEDLLLLPGRYGRPGNILIILRGLPGSGKSYLARLIKEKELAMGGSAPRILSIDDYYVMLDDTGSVTWSLDLEEQYRQNLMKSLKRNLDDGHFSFFIVDALHSKADEISEVFTAANARGFAVFLAELSARNNSGPTRKCNDEDLEKISKSWEEAPKEIPRLDVTWFFKEKTTDRTPSPEDRVTSTTSNFDEVKKEENFSSGLDCSMKSYDETQDSHESSNESPAVSKWEMMEQTEEKLDRLDGIVKRKTTKPVSVEDWLQSGLPEEYIQRKRDESGKKRVRWADVEEKLQQEKMRDMGFVVGHTDWSKMTNTASGESALTQTKYI